MVVINNFCCIISFSPGVFFSLTRKQLDLLLDILHSMDDLDSLLFVFQQIKNKPDYSRFAMCCPLILIDVVYAIVVSYLYLLSV